MGGDGSNCSFMVQLVFFLLMMKHVAFLAGQLYLCPDGNLSDLISSQHLFLFLPQSELERKREVKQREREAREKEARKREKAEEKEKRRREYNAQMAAVAAREQQKKKSEEKKKKNGQAAGGTKGLDDATLKGIICVFFFFFPQSCQVKLPLSLQYMVVGVFLKQNYSEI